MTQRHLFPKKKASGQGMVEFALVLPLLLLVSFGIIELGRLILVYTSVMAGSREAARYASAAGFAEDGITPYYLDAAGIEAAARRIAVMTGVTVEIYYDHGPDTSTFTPTSPAEVVLGDRVVIVVNSTFTPLLGVTPLKPFSIAASTSRTLLKNVSIYGNPPSTSDFTVNINSPAVANFVSGESIYFAASAQNASGTVAYTWSSDRDGAIGSSDSFATSSLSAGVHTIILLGADSDGDTDTDQIVITISGRPEVQISSPQDNDHFQEGFDISFAGAAVDAEDGDLSPNLVWTREGGEVIGNGAAFNAQLPVGLHTITAETTDSSGLTGSASVSIIVEAELPPMVVIGAPLEGESFQENTEIWFSGAAVDLSDGSLSDQLVWKLADGTQIGQGPSFNAQLPAGTHTITAEVPDSDGLMGQDTVTIVVTVGEPPQVEIISPQDGATFDLGEEIPFAAEALDPDSEAGSIALYWFIDDAQDPFHSGNNFVTSNLPEGTHTIRVQAVDGDQNSAWDSITLTVIDNSPPVVTIGSPADGANTIEAQPVIFQGIATDEEDGDLSASLEWYSNLVTAGAIGAGSTFTLTNLAPGTHTITARVSDSGNPPLSGEDTHTLVIRADPCKLQFAPVAIDKKKLSWGFVNNGLTSYTLTTLTMPWTDDQSNQALQIVQMGTLDAPYILWEGRDSTDGSTFGAQAVGVEFPWTPVAPNFRFEAGPGRTEVLVLGFKLDINAFPGTMIVVFKNDETADLCTYTYSISQ